jgi:lactoylglutathione lyase
MTDSASKTPATVDVKAPGFMRFAPRLGMVSFRVADIERSLAFYAGVLGMREVLRLPGFGPDERELVLEYPGGHGAVLMLMWNVQRKQPYPIGEGYSRISILVDDTREALKYLAEHSIPVLIPPMDVNKVVFAVVTDPDGYMIELLQGGQELLQSGHTHVLYGDAYST